MSMTPTTDKKVYIYGLRTKGSDEVRYVGKTVDLHGRLAKHKATANPNSNHPKEQWIASESNVEIVTLEVCGDSDWAEREIYWIKYYRSMGHRITNVSLVKGLGGHRSGGGGRAYSMYINPQVGIMFERVHDHYGRHLSVGDVIRKLVEEYASRIEGGEVLVDDWV